MKKEGKHYMDKEYFTKLCAARDILCDFCEADECDQCMVSHLINDAYDELPGEEDD